MSMFATNSKVKTKKHQEQTQQLKPMSGTQSSVSGTKLLTLPSPPENSIEWAGLTC